MKFPPGATIQEQLNLALTRIDELEDELRAYKRDELFEIDDDWIAYMADRLKVKKFRLPRLLNALWETGRRKGLPARRERIFIYTGFGDEIERKSIDVYVCYLRGIFGKASVKTHNNYGFSLSTEMCEKLNALWDEFRAARDD